MNKKPLESFSGPIILSIIGALLGVALSIGVAYGALNTSITTNTDHIDDLEKDVESLHDIRVMQATTITEVKNLTKSIDRMRGDIKKYTHKHDSNPG